MTDTFHCFQCDQDLETPEGTCGTGYATNSDGHKFCYACCALQDRQEMAEEGKIMLYLIHGPREEDYSWGKVEISNWPGTLRFTVGQRRLGRHNIAGKRYDVWFAGPDSNGDIKATWHGVSYGDNTQIIHCKRIKG